MGNINILALIIGLIIGFSTHYTSPFLAQIGQGFVLLLQMTALPYIAVSLIFGIGSMSRIQAKKLAVYGTITFFILLLCALIIILIAPTAFPKWQSAAFYNPSIANVAPPQDFLKMFIPANPFASFAESTVPAIVIFSIFVGVGFIGVENKRRSLYVFKDIRHALSLVTNAVMKVSPIGFLAIAWNASASIKPDELNAIAVYTITAASIVVLLTFMILPMLLAIITPLSYKQVLQTAKEAAVTAFATGSLFVVLPIIVESVRDQLRDYAKTYNDARRIPSVIVPISYSLPLGGKLLSILFVLFAGWFAGEDIALSQYPELIAISLMQLFGSVMIAVPNLLTSFNINDGMFELFLISEQVIVSRLSALMSVMFITALSLLVTLLLMNKVRFYPKSFFSFVLAAPLGTWLILWALSYGFDAITHQYQGYEKFINRNLLLPAVEHNVLKQPDLNHSPNHIRGDVLARIAQRGYLRMGYYRDSLPYTFHNKNGELVGMDIEIAHLLATELNVGLEFVQIYRDQTQTLLQNGYLDMVSGIPVTPSNLLDYTLTQAYLSEPVALLVKDERRVEFSQWAQILTQGELIIGVPEAFFYAKGIRKNMPNLEVWELSTPRLFFKEQGKNIDAMLYGAAGATAWTLLYPEYSVVIPKPNVAPIAYAFPITSEDQHFANFLNNWITMKQRSGTLDAFFTYWIEGKPPGIFVK
ncbi:cation:dicarboxylate symporter family transporter [Thalassotalea aquiviva]|uniref:cation:dicarboxylate symporter family transporter n=1 Tax=Thalassotalea aquiviva TaxID=3242415 RepID=UPI00352B3B42